MVASVGRCCRREGTLTNVTHSFGVVYSPAQFGWLQELQQKEKAGESVAVPESYSESDLEALQKVSQVRSRIIRTIGLTQPVHDRT